jgi:hypothetical protein
VLLNELVVAATSLLKNTYVEDELWSLLLGGSFSGSADSEGRRVDSRKSRSKEASKFS